MNQKNYNFLVLSLLLASYTMNLASMNNIRNNIHRSPELEDMDDEPMERSETLSPDEAGMSKEKLNQKRQQDQKDLANYKWSQKYASKIARYFFNRDYETISSDDLQKYLEKNSDIRRDSLLVDTNYMLGVVNGLLEKAELNHKIALIANSFVEEKQLSELKDFDTIANKAMQLFGGLKSKFGKKLNKMSTEEKNKILAQVNAVLQGQPTDIKDKNFKENIQHVVDSFVKEGKESVAGFSEIVERAKTLKISDYFTSQLEKLTDREKDNVFLMIDMMLPTVTKVSNTLELARAVAQEDKKATEKAKETEKEFEEYLKKHDITTPEELKKHVLVKLRPSILKLIDRDVHLPTVTSDSLGDIEDITKDEFFEQVRKDGLDDFFIKALNKFDEGDIHKMIREVVMQDRVAASLDLAKAVAEKGETFEASEKEDIKFDTLSLKRHSADQKVASSLDLARAVAINKGADSDEDMKPSYESGSDEDKEDEVAASLDLARAAQEDNQGMKAPVNTSVDDENDFDDNDDEDGMRAPQNTSEEDDSGNDNNDDSDNDDDLGIKDMLYPAKSELRRF